MRAMLIPRYSTYTRMGKIMFALWVNFLTRINSWSSRKLNEIFEWDVNDIDWDDECEDCA